MVAFHLRGPGVSERPLDLAPGCYTAGGGSGDSLSLEGAPSGLFELDLCDQQAIVTPCVRGISLNGKPLDPGRRFLLLPGERLAAEGFELRRGGQASPPRVRGTAAIARALLGDGLGAPVHRAVPSLVWLNGCDCGRKLRLLDERTIVGRGEAAVARVRDALASRAHAKLLIEESRARIIDLSSSNGLFVNGERVECSRELKGGEILLIGETELLFEADLAEPAPPAVPSSVVISERALLRRPVVSDLVLGMASFAGAMAAAIWLLSR